MIDLYAGWTLEQKTAKYEYLRDILERLTIGGLEYKIVDEDTGEVVYTAADKLGLERQLYRLQIDLGLATARNSIPITFGC